MKRVVSFLLSFILFFGICFPKNVLAFDREKHNEYLKQVMFGKVEYKTILKDADAKEKFEAIGYASQLAIDSYGEKGNSTADESYLDKLNSTYKIKNLPDTIDDIILSGDKSGSHRKYTHRGWDFEYDDKEVWNNRKNILLETVNQTLDNGLIAKMKGKVLGDGYPDKTVCFSELVYYVHILADYCKFYEDSNKKKENDNLNTYLTDTDGKVIPLANKKEDDDSICSELLIIVEKLFADNTNSNEYKDLVEKIERINKKTATIHITQDYNDKNISRFKNYYEKADELMDALIKHVPKLLKEEKWFSEAFLS